jgi:hypothetical protein
MSQPGGLAPERFAQMVIERLKTAGFTDLALDGANFSIHYRSPENRGAINLGNYYAKARGAPPAEVAKLIDGILEPLSKRLVQTHSEGFDAAASHLMPVVRDKRYFGMSNLMMVNSGIDPSPGTAMQFRPMVGEVVIALVRDTERQMLQITQGILDGWGVTFDQALDRALANLRARSPLKFKENGNGLFVSAWNDDYDGSRVLMPELLGGLPIVGNPVVSMPSRNHLLVAGSRDRAALDRLVNATAVLLESEQRPMTAQLMKFEKGKWLPFEENLPSLPKLREAGFKLIHRDYAQQKDLLDSILAKKKKDIFVATAKAFQAKDGTGFLSLTQWTKTVVTLLPKTDRLALLSMDTREMIIVPWSVAAEVLGARLQSQGMEPERYLASDYPDDSQLAKLRAAALTVTTIPAG